jgi:hypothetical protein
MATCAACQQPLILIIQDEENTSVSSSQDFTVPDDVHLQCNCHFHWQCLLDAYQITECPNCERQISTIKDGHEEVICSLNNEGGLQENLDILPLLREESYLKAYPDERKSRAFLEFVREGDIEAAIDLLKAEDSEDEDEDEDEDDEMPQQDATTILRYQDPLDSMNSALHLAVLNERIEIVWLLLLLASNLESHHFPYEVQAAATQYEIHREDQAGKTDIRTLQDSEGRTAAVLAAVNHLNFNIELLYDQ